jgi:outer membrane protein TolC
MIDSFKSQVLYSFFIFLLTSFYTQTSDAQEQNLLEDADLPGIIDYALANQPAVQQSKINEEITRLQVKNKLADWYPQINSNYVYQRNFQLPVSIIGGNPVRFGVNNTSALQFTATQNIFNRDAIFAGRTKSDVRLLAAKQTENAKINLVSDVSKSFYDLLATEQQRKVTDENITMLQRSLKDSRARYDAGVTDKTDYQRATIALNNAMASKKEIEEALKAKMANLKYVINYPADKPLTLQYDSTTLEQEIYMDTLMSLDYSQRVEYQALQAQLRLQEANVSYSKWAFLPSLSANAAHLLNFQNDNIDQLYNRSYPNTYAALTLGLPIFQGGKRRNNILIAQRQVEQIKLDLTDFTNQANSEYENAMARYKSSMANYIALKENKDLAENVYRIIELQYREGIKTYLEVITSQTDLRTAQINYFNAVYGLLSSKIDVQRAEGEIKVQ